MMKRLAIAALLPALAVLAGCQTTNSVSEAEFNRTVTTLRLSKSQREAFYRSCLEDNKDQTVTDKKMMAVITGSTPAESTSVYCRNLTDGLASGKLRYEDFTAVF